MTTMRLMLLKQRGMYLPIPSRGLVGWWDMSDTSLGDQFVRDLSRLNHTLTLGTSDSSDTADPTRGTYDLDFDTSNDTVRIPASAYVGTSLAHMIVLVVNPTGDGLIYGESKSSGETEWLYLERLATTSQLKVRYRRITGTTYDVSLTTAGNSFPASYQCVMVRRDGTELTAWIGGVKKETKTLGGSALSSISQAALNSVAGASLPSRGGASVANLALYRRALTDSEMTAVYTYLKTLYANRGISL